MALAAEPPSSRPSGEARRAPEPSVLGVGTVVWLASEMMFFAGLFAAYFTLRSVNTVWPPAGVELPVARTALATVVLLASSVTMHLAVEAAKQGRVSTPQALRWLGVTAVLGCLFLSNQVLEYAEAPFSMDDHAYGSIFYLMTGFHGLHVLGGLLFMGAIAVLMSRPAPVEGGVARHEALEVCGYYWHFVDAIWVAMFTSVYLLQ